MRPLTHEWVAKAEGDFRAGLVLRREKRPLYDAVCFHAQPCAEKYAKAWLVEGSIWAPKIPQLLKCSSIFACLHCQSYPHTLQQQCVKPALPLKFVILGTSATKSDAQIGWKATCAMRQLIRQKLGL